MLLEALIAVIILAVIGVGILNLADSIATGSLRIRQSLCAGWVLKNQVASLAIMNPGPTHILPKGDSMMCGEDWHWQVNQQASHDPRIRLYTVAVFGEGGRLAEQTIMLPKG